ncbi:MAG: SOS response-associated peptidase [Candidatus Saccharimonadaceae bacterium]
MISHYALYDTSELSNHFHLEGLPKGIKPHYNISPTINAPVIVNDGGVHTAKLMKWGLLAIGAKDINSVFRYKTYNIASEKIFSRHSWEQAVREKRCLVPANGFYELNGSGSKRAYFVQSKDKAMVSFAGVYNLWQDPDGVAHGSFSIITIEADSDMPSFSSRMPVIIKREDEARWLDPTISEMGPLYDMLRPYPTGQLNAYEVSSAVHSPKPNAQSLIEGVK